MNPHFCWQSFCFNPDIQYQTNYLFNNYPFQTIQETSYQEPIDELRKKCDLLMSQNQKLKEQIAQIKAKKLKRKKKHVKRRKEQELDKIYKCNFPHCKKDYASTLALNLHIKKKHNSQSTTTSTQKKSSHSFSESYLKQQEYIGSSS